MYRCLVGVIGLLLWVVVAEVRAEEPLPPFSYTATSPDRRYVFVMIAPISLDEDLAIWGSADAERVRTIRERYSASGLYLNDGSTRPLWTVGWYAHQVTPYSDGVHAIRHGPWADSVDAEAVTFLANGKILATYTVRDLVIYPSWLPHASQGVRWRGESTIDDDGRVLVLETSQYDHYVFDATSGLVVRSRRPSRWITASILTVVFVGSMVAWRLMRWRRELRLDQAARYFVPPGEAVGRN
jgi:hypothetical protein